MTSDQTPQDPYGGNPYYGPPTAPPGSEQQGYPPGYQQGPPYGGYPQAYGYPQQLPYGSYPYPQPYPPYVTAPPGRPGTMTASAVLAFVGGGLLIAAALLLFAGASVIHDLADSANVSSDPTTTEFTAAGFANLVIAGLLIPGGVMVLGRKHAGRTLLIAGGAIVIAAAVYWLVRFGGYGTTVFYALLFSALAVISVALAFTEQARTWLAGGPAGKSAPK